MSTDHDILNDGEFLEEADILEGTCDTHPTDLMSRIPGNLLIIEPNLSRGRNIKTGHIVEQGGLASPIGSDETGDQSTFHLKINFIDGNNASVSSGKSLCFQQNHCSPPVVDAARLRYRVDSLPRIPCGLQIIITTRIKPNRICLNWGGMTLDSPVS